MSMNRKVRSWILNTISAASGGRKPLPPEVEQTQVPIGKSPLYNDSFYFNFFDTEKSIGGFTWIGKLHNAGAVNSVQVIYGPDDAAYVKFGGEPYPAHSPRLECGGIYYQNDEAFKRWHIASAGPMMPVSIPSQDCDPETFLQHAESEDMADVRLDLEFNALGPPHNSKDFHAPFLARQMQEKNFGLRDLALVRKIAANHYEQSGICTGSLAINGEKYSIRATGHRDHSWGIRDWHAPAGWTWLSVQFGSDVALNLCRVLIGKVDLFMGHIFREGCNYPLKNCSLETQYESDGHTQKAIAFAIEDTGGFSMEVHGKPRQIIRLAREDGEAKVVVNESQTRYMWEGREANGISEYLHKIS